MSTLSCKECKMGMEVLLTHPDSCYTIGEDNPATNTEWECVGTIIRKGDHSVKVAWNDGNENVYRSGELSAAINDFCIDIW